MPQNEKKNLLEKAIYEPLEESSFEYEKFIESKILFSILSSNLI